ncbi:MAG: HD domain-containing protein [Methylotenera sp.]|nr:HD domain-containing protein [Methylotenera sp.]
MQIPLWFHSLRAQIGLAILLIFLMLVGTLGYTSYALNLRQHDYLILNLTGQLRVISLNMTNQARHYVAEAPDDNAKFTRDLGTYWQDLQKQTALYSKIVSALDARVIDADLSGKTSHGKIYCTWDEQSRQQMNKTVAFWNSFNAELKHKIGDNINEPRLTWAAEYIEQNGAKLEASSERLTNAFQRMMEEKLNAIRIFQLLTAALSLAIFIIILVMIQKLIISPLNSTLKGFSRISNGDFSHQLPVLGRNEIGKMTSAFNRLTVRLNSMFRLTDRINQGKKLDEMLGFVHEEFQSFVPLDWVGVFYANPDGSKFTLERQFSQLQLSLKEGDSFTANLGGLHTLSEYPLTLNFTTSSATQGSLEAALVHNNLRSAVYLPLLSKANNRAIMVFASADLPYQQEHVDFISNIAATISHVLEKTVVTENLVTSAVQGMAKLAESRDPETGDHLVRMALYSALIAEELGHIGPYTTKITPAYVRDVFHFAPMHDIGKVGVRDDVLLKPGKLDADERKEIEQHPTIGGEVLRRCEAQMEALGHSMFKIGIEIAECHHEKFDGSGYPAGLIGQSIPLSARIVSAADVFDALTSKRPYKEAWTVEAALNAMQQDSGKHFDPDILAAIMRALPRIMEIYNQYKHV